MLRVRSAEIVRRLAPEFPGRVRLEWPALSLKQLNRVPSAKPMLEAELEVARRLEPDLPGRV